MTEKHQLLSELGQLVKAGQISQAEILAALGQQPQPSARHRINLSEAMYYIGGGIVFLGICVLVFQNWDNLSSAVRILITLGSAVAAYIVAAIFYRYPDLLKISQAFFLIAGLLAPLALNVTFRESGFDITLAAVQVLIFAILTLVFLGSLPFFRQPILVFFGTIFATGLFFALVSWLVGPNLLQENLDKLWQYRVLVAGLAWLALGYYLGSTAYGPLGGVMYGFGSIAFLGSALALGGFQPNQNAFWELVYPLLVFGLIFISVSVKSRAMLVFGTLFLIGYILKITGEYFQSGLGWPLALVLAGLVIMGIGYYAVRLNKKYFAQKI